MDVTAISSAYTALKIMREAIAAIMDAKIDEAARQRINEALEKIGGIQDTLFFLREELSRIQNENAALKGKLNEIEAWEVRFAEYQLEETEGGAVVYKYKGQPTHFACPNCVNKKEIQILQDRRVVAGIYDCPGCDKSFPVKPSQPFNHRRVIDPGVT